MNVQKFSTLRVNGSSVAYHSTVELFLLQEDELVNSIYPSRIKQVQIGCLHVCDTQWLRSLVKGSIEAAHFFKVNIDFHKFLVKGAVSTFKPMQNMQTEKHTYDTTLLL